MCMAKSVLVPKKPFILVIVYKVLSFLSLQNLFETCNEHLSLSFWESWQCKANELISTCALVWQAKKIRHWHESFCSSPFRNFAHEVGFAVAFLYALWHLLWHIQELLHWWEEHFSCAFSSIYWTILLKNFMFLFVVKIVQIYLWKARIWWIL